MSQRLTPLTRNQLLELEALVRQLITAVSQPPPPPPSSSQYLRQQHQQQQLQLQLALQNTSTPASLGDESWPPSGPTTPTSLALAAGGAEKVEPDAFPATAVTTSGAARPASSAFAGLSTSGYLEGVSPVMQEPLYAAGRGQAAAAAVPDHPVLHGTFLDVFSDPLTATAWRLYDKILYLVWWSYRPPSCTNCGMQDAWMPSGDVEFKCAFCIAGAGTTRSNAVVEDDPGGNEEGDYGNNDSGDDDEVDEKDKGSGGGMGGGGGGGAGGVSGGPIEAYLFFYEWLQRIPLLGPAGATNPSTSSHDNNNRNTNTTVVAGSGATDTRDASGGLEADGGSSSSSSPQRQSAVAGRVNVGLGPASMYDRGGSAATTHFAGSGVRSSVNVSQPQQSQLPQSIPSGASKGVGSGGAATAGAGPAGASSSILLPTGESLPAVLRAAYDMSSLLTTPGLPHGTAPILRAAGLYMSLLLHRYVSLFPLFCLAGRVSTSPKVDASQGNNVVDLSSARTAAAAATAVGGLSAMKSTSPQGRGDVDGAPLVAEGVELQWVDVELVCALLGVAAPSFFESTEVAVQHLQNVFTVAAGYGVPSVLWHPGRVPGRVEVMKALKDKVIPICPLHSTSAGVSGLSPEHTAMVVALEFARRVDAHPIAASSSSPAAAAQNAQRIGMWLDALGLYPTRRVYRDVHSFHHLAAQEKKGEEGEGEGGGRMSSNNSNNKRGDEEAQDVMRAWERTLTELAAVNDSYLLAAADRHAHRHDASTSSAFDLTGNPTASTPAAAAAALTTSRSPFYRRFEWILTSPCANALLHVFAAVFRMPPMELADMALRSGIYRGHACGFVATLQTAMLRGAYDVMPLARRLSPLTSSWMAAYMALHSGDRLPLLAALFQFNDGQNAAPDRRAALTRLVQRILRKHHAAQLYQLNYILRVTDEDEKHFNGIYFLSNVLWQEGLAVFTCLRSGRKTITLNRFARTLSLCYLNSKEKVVSRLNMRVVSPVVAAVETDAARLVMEIALGAVARGVDTRGDPWGVVVRCLDRCARVRRRMRVPMLASRLDALASIREHASAVVTRRYSQFSSLGGAGVGGMFLMGPTLLGWGETETLLSAAPALDVRLLRRDLQWNFLALPHVSLLSGLSENRVVAMYASLVGLLELIHERLAAQQQQQQQLTTTNAATVGGGALLQNWVEELLFVEDDEEAEDGLEGGGVNAFVHDFGSPFTAGERSTGLGWSPPQYRNSRGGTPKLSRSPKSKFTAVSTAATNAAGPTSAFTTSYTSTTANSRYAPTPPLSFARQPYTMTPPALAPVRSPILRSLPAANSTANTATTTPPLTAARGAFKANNYGNPPASTSAFAVTNTQSAAPAAPSFTVSSHNAVSTPIHRFQTPPSTTVTSITTTTATTAAASRTPPLSFAGSGSENKRGTGKAAGGADLWLGEGGGGAAGGMDGLTGGGMLLPDLELSASTADVEKRQLNGGKGNPAAAAAAAAAGPQRSPRRRGEQRRRERTSGRLEDNDEEDYDNNNDDDTAGRGAKSRRCDPHRTNSSNDTREEEEEEAQERQEKVLQLLRQSLPPYWEVLLGVATDLTLPGKSQPQLASAVNAAGGRRHAHRSVEDKDDDEDDEEGDEDGKGTRTAATHISGFDRVDIEDARRTAAHTRERRLRRQQQQQQQQQNAVSMSNNTNSNSGGGSSGGRLRASPLPRTHHERERDGALLAPSSYSPAAAAAVLRNEVAITHRPFNLFDAEECRRRLHRLYVFIGTYIQCKQRCEAQAAAGTLPALPKDKPTGLSSPTSAHLTPSSSKPTAAPTANAPLLHSPRNHLTPPPPYPLAAAAAAEAEVATSGKTAGSEATRKKGGEAQRSPPRPRPSPPMAPQRRPSPHHDGPPPPSPPHSPDPRSSNNHNTTTGTLKGGEVTRDARGGHRVGSGGTSPVPLSPSLDVTRRGDGGDREGRSPKQQQQQQTKRNKGSSPLSTKNSSTNVNYSGGGSGGDAGVSVRDGRDETAVALVDDADFALPPSETSWEVSQHQQHGGGGGGSRAGRASNTTENAKTRSEKFNLFTPANSTKQEVRRTSKQQQQQQHVSATAPPNPAASSSSASSDSEMEEGNLKVELSRPPATRKRVRDDSDDDDNARQSAEKTNSKADRLEQHTQQREEENDSDASGRSSDKDEEEEQQQDAAPLRRKVKKSGRRRRRQEQNIQYQQQQQQQQQQQANKAASPSRSSDNNGSASRDPSRSPEVRAWRNGRISGSVSPLGNSPALPPRPSNVHSATSTTSGVASKASKTRSEAAAPAGGGVLRSPTEKAVPSIRERTARASHESAAPLSPSPSSSSSSVSSPPSAAASDSGRSADYDTDKN